MKIIDKMLLVYAKATKNLDEDPDFNRSGGVFHRNKKYAFFMEARRLDKDGYLPEETRRVG